jgi:hypothetical protein
MIIPCSGDGLHVDDHRSCQHRPFRARSDDLEVLAPHPGIPSSRLDDRKSLLRGLDDFARHADTLGEAGLIDEFTSRALDIISSPRAEGPRGV